MHLLSEWNKASDQWNAISPPYMLEADADFLRSYATVTYHSWDEANQAPEFCGPHRNSDKRLHLGLLPGPFMGDMLNASIYVLMTNPGVTRDDYKEHQQPAIRSAFLANLRQERLAGVLPFLFLDRQFAWHDGFDYWNGKVGLGKTIQEVANRRGDI